MKLKKGPKLKSWSWEALASYKVLANMYATNSAPVSEMQMM